MEKIQVREQRRRAKQNFKKSIMSLGQFLGDRSLLLLMCTQQSYGSENGCVFACPKEKRKAIKNLKPW